MASERNILLSNMVLCAEALLQDLKSRGATFSVCAGCRGNEVVMWRQILEPDNEVFEDVFLRPIPKVVVLFE